MASHFNNSTAKLMTFPYVAISKDIAVSITHPGFRMTNSAVIIIKKKKKKNNARLSSREMAAIIRKDPSVLFFSIWWIKTVNDVCWFNRGTCFEQFSGDASAEVTQVIYCSLSKKFVKTCKQISWPKKKKRELTNKQERGENIQ